MLESLLVTNSRWSTSFLAKGPDVGLLMAWEEKESKLQAVRQNLAMTAKDVEELRQEVMNEDARNVG